MVIGPYFRKTPLWVCLALGGCFGPSGIARGVEELRRLEFVLRASGALKGAGRGK